MSTPSSSDSKQGAAAHSAASIVVGSDRVQQCVRRTYEQDTISNATSFISLGPMSCSVAILGAVQCYLAKRAAGHRKQPPNDVPTSQQEGFAYKYNPTQIGFAEEGEPAPAFALAAQRRHREPGCRS
ncbi:hypothetical protein PybrP1_006220 [[Pythium] brassicae (nom. inval.)]|nr:hypothetical protein PybrP1_006220 [[Pythium] brassicae (nom. inval.)]